MTDTPQESTVTPPAPAMSLPARFGGIIFSPRSTYANVAAHPRWLGMFLLVFLIMSAATMALLSTEVGRTAVLDRQMTAIESGGAKATQVQLDQLEKFAPYLVYVTPVLQLGFLGLGGLVITGIAFSVLGAAMGGEGTFKQTFAVVTHSAVIIALLSLFMTPLAYARESLASATNLAVFLPFLDDSSFLARLLGSIDLIYIWWMLSLAIGLGVLYRKRTGPIAITLLLLYVAIGVIIAAIKTASSGV